MTTENEDTARLKFLATALNEAIVHIAVRPEKGIVQLYTRPSDWTDTTKGDKVTLDDLRILVDQAIAQAKEKK